jgi:hypothetical protein
LPPNANPGPGSDPSSNSMPWPATNASRDSPAAPNQTDSPMEVDEPLDLASDIQYDISSPTNDGPREFFEESHPLQSPYQPQSAYNSRTPSPLPDDHPMQSVRRSRSPIPLPNDPTAQSHEHDSQRPESGPVGQDPIPAPRQPIDAYNSSHSLWFVRVVMLLVAVLHTRHHLSFRGCSLILSCLSVIFLALQVIPVSNRMPISFPTVLHKLDLNDCFITHPICHSCHAIFTPDVDKKMSCCGQRIFSDPDETYFERMLGRPLPPPTPITSAPVQLLSGALPDFLNRGSNEKSCEFWKRDKVRPGKRTEIWHGDVWGSIKGCDRRPFFEAQETSDELRLGVTLSLDW